METTRSQRARGANGLRHLWDVIRYRAVAELRAEATRTYAGYLWWVLQPLLMFAVYYVAFNYVVGSHRDHFAVFLFTGIILWQWFHVSVLRCAGSLIVSRALMQRVNLHKTVFPLSIILVNTIKFLVTLAILLVVLLAAGFTPGWSWLLLPALLAAQLLVIVACGCFAAMLSPFVPDFQHVLATILQLLFFVSGIIYDLSILPERIQRVLMLNPMAIVIGQTRELLMHHQTPQWGLLAIPLAESALVMGVSLMLLHRFNKVYPKLG